jgi:two-component system, sensor histidine kinase and response regulator
MKKLLQEINKETITLEQLQKKISLIFVALTFFSIVFFGLVDFLAGQSFDFLIIRLVFAILFIGCFVLYYKYNKYLLATNLMLFFVWGFLLINYVYSDGYQGPTIFNFFVYVGVVAFLLKYPLNIFWHLFSIASYILSFYLEITGKLNVIYNYQNVGDEFWDNSLTIVVTSFFVFIGATIVIKNYQKQNLALEKLQSENKKNLKELQLINEKKNQLIALLSHDLKNPIASLTTTLELMDLDLISKEDFEFVVSNIKKQSVHLNHVLSNTLNWVVNEMGQQAIEYSIVDIAVFTDEIQELMQIQASGKDQIIERVIKEEVFSVELEKEEVKIILRNYISNAIKYSPVGSTIFLEFLGDSNSFRWNVINPGPEIPQDIQNQLFDFNVKSALGTQKEMGTGLGLSLCRKIADKIGMNLGYERTADGLNLFYLERTLIHQNHA